jgi:DNA polymerase-3 subunit beta
MKFTCLQQNFSKGLAVVAKAIPTKNMLPILSNVYISAENGQIKLCATNTETTIVTYIGASIEKEGAITVPAKMIKELISTLSPDTLVAELKGLNLYITSSKTNSKLNGTDPSDYPHMPTFNKEGSYLELDPKAFSNAVSIVAFSSATDDARPLFTGVFTQYQDKVLTLASSDGFRLAEKTLNIESDLPDFSVIIPAKSLLEVSRIFASSSEPIKMAINEEGTVVLFESEGTLVASNTLNGEYPNYKRIIPEEHVLSALFNASDLSESVKLTNIFAQDTNAVKLRFHPDGHILVTSAGDEIGVHESKIPAEIEGEETEIAFNSKYLLDFLNNVKAEKIQFKAKTTTSPCLFLPSEIENYLHVIAPMQIQR